MRSSRRRLRGFTLLELVVVLAILATLAGLVISQVSMLGRSTDMAASAKTQADVANNLQLFFVLQKRFPQNMDSLLVNNGGTFEVYGPRGAGGVTITSEAQQYTGLPISSPALWQDLTPVELSTLETAGEQYRRSLSRLGFDTVMDHDRAAINSNDSGTAQRSILNGTGTGAASTIWVARIASGSPAAQKVYPGTNGAIPPNTVLVALGVGPRSSCVPTTMMNAPIYPGCDGRYYGRYVAVFALSATGERGTLVGVCDPYGRFSDYTIQQYNESLPNNSRQG